jgi:predicted Zn-dependent protease
MMARFPQNVVVPTAYAETLRDLGRQEEALEVFKDTMTRFPQDEVAPTAYAGTLRDLGRREEALEVFKDTMARFPQNEVVPNAYAHLLIEMGRILEAEQILFPATQRAKTRNDWIAVHVLAMAKLRSGFPEGALSEFERGVRHCKFPDSLRYFISGRSLALIATKRAKEASQILEKLAKDPALPREEVTNIILFEAHALAEAGDVQRAKSLLESAEIIDFAVAKQKRFAKVLSERYSLGANTPTTRTAQQLSAEIEALEFELATPKFNPYRIPVYRSAA